MTTITTLPFSTCPPPFIHPLLHIYALSLSSSHPFTTQPLSHPPVPAIHSLLSISTLCPFILVIHILHFTHSSTRSRFHHPTTSHSPFIHSSTSSTHASLNSLIHSQPQSPSNPSLSPRIFYHPSSIQLPHPPTLPFPQPPLFTPTTRPPLLPATQ